MQPSELDALIDKTATLMVQYERRGAAVDARLQQLAHVLESVGQRLPEVVRTSAGSLVHSVPAEVADMVGRDLDRPIREYRAHLQAAGDEVNRSVKSLSAELDRMRAVQRLLLWKLVGSAAAVLALLLGGGAWLASYYAGVVRVNQVSAEAMQAYQRADVVLCGKHGLCANVDSAGARYGDQRQYRPVRRR